MKRGKYILINENWCDSNQIKLAPILLYSRNQDKNRLGKIVLIDASQLKLSLIILTDQSTAVFPVNTEEQFTDIVLYDTTFFNRMRNKSAFARLYFLTKTLSFTEKIDF